MNRPRPIQKQSSTVSEQSDRDVITILQQDDQELAEAKIRAQGGNNNQQGERLQVLVVAPPTTVLQMAETGRDVITILREDDQELAEAKARAKSESSASSPNHPKRKKKGPNKTESAPAASSSSFSSNQKSTQLPANSHQINFFRDKNAKEKAKLASSNNNRQYTNRNQALAVNMALRKSQQDTPSEIINSLLQEEEEEEEEEKREETSDLFRNEMVLIDGTSDHAALNRGGGAGGPNSQPGAFRVGTSFAPAQSSESEADISWGDEGQQQQQQVEEEEGNSGMTPVEENNDMDRSEKSQVVDGDAAEAETPTSNNDDDDSNSSSSNINTIENGDILVEATLVSAEEVDLEKGPENETVNIIPEPELVTAEAMSETYGAHEMIKNRDGRRWILGFTALVLTVLLVASIVIGVVVKRNKNDNNKGPVITMAPTMAPTSFVEDALPEATQVAVETPGTPQSKAYDWYLEDQQFINSMIDLAGTEPSDLQSYVPMQRFALATLYYATNGHTWFNARNWLDHDKLECDWYTTFFGSVCSPGAQSRRLLRGLQADNATAREPLYYNRLSLNKNNITGTFPPEVALIPYLDVLNIHGNFISGTVPTEFGTFQHLTLFQLFDNQLTGTIPSQLGMLPKVRQLNLAYNEFMGTIPSELGQLGQSLLSLSASNNPIEGTIPIQIGNLSNLEGLFFYNNPNVTGPIPSELGLLTRMTHLQLNEANYTGTLPTELGRVQRIQKIYLSDNWNLEGSIPESWGNLTNLELLQLHNTGLTGLVPGSLCTLVDQGKLQLSVDCDLVTCNCSCDCNQSAGLGGGEIVTTEPVQEDDIDGGELVTSSPIMFGSDCFSNSTNATNTSEVVNCRPYLDDDQFDDDLVTLSEPVWVDAPENFTAPPRDFIGVDPPQPFTPPPPPPPEFFDEAELYEQRPDAVSKRSGSSNIFSHL